MRHGNASYTMNKSICSCWANAVYFRSFFFFLFAKKKNFPLEEISSKRVTVCQGKSNENNYHQKCFDKIWSIVCILDGGASAMWMASMKINSICSFSWRWKKQVYKNMLFFSFTFLTLQVHNCRTFRGKILLFVELINIRSIIFRVNDFFSVWFGSYFCFLCMICHTPTTFIFVSCACFSVQTSINYPGKLIVLDFWKMVWFVYLAKKRSFDSKRIEKKIISRNFLKFSIPICFP